MSLDKNNIPVGPEVNVKRTIENPTPEQIEALVAECSGRGGSEDELHVSVEGWRKDTVEVGGTMLAKVGAVLRRCGSAVVSIVVIRDGEALESLWLTVNKVHNGRKVFRGPEYAFAPVDVESKPFPKAQEVEADAYMVGIEERGERS
jgi:hypothetical protein